MAVMMRAEHLCGLVKQCFPVIEMQGDFRVAIRADPEMVLIKRYGLLRDKTMYGKPVTGVERTTYLIGRDTGDGQRLLHVFPKVTPAGHAEEVFTLLQEKPVVRH